MQTYSSQEENRHAMWDTTGKTNLATLKLPRLAVVPNAVVNWLSKTVQIPNELKVWLEKMMRTDLNYKKKGLIFILCIFNGGSTDGPKRQKKQCPENRSVASHRHRPKIL